MDKFRCAKTISIPVSFMKDLQEFNALLEEVGIDCHSIEVYDAIINKASEARDYCNGYNDIIAYIEYREEE